MKIRINNVEYDCVEGSLLTRNFNETLDNANVRISHLEELIEIEPFDSAEIIIGNETIYMLVDSYECIEEGLDPIYYTYEISLFSLTKQLENIILPNIAITPNSENRSIYYYLEQYLREYGTNVYWNLSQDGELARFDNIPCPEMQWNTPTLREVFDDLMMIGDCICVFKGPNTISCLDLTTRGNEITDYNYIRRSRSSQDYVSDIKMNLQNAMEDYSTIKTEIIPFSANSGYVLTSENFCIKTQFPIRKINHCWMSFLNSADYQKRVRVDLMTYLDGPLILEEEAYRLLYVLYIKTANTIPYRTDAYKYQNFCLHYQRYSNVITGLSEVISNLFSSLNKMSYILDLMNRLILEHVSVETNDYYTTLFFEIEYETTADLIFSASKAKLPKHKRTIMDNQTNSFVNTKAQANLEYQKANRLGNEQLLINQRANSLNDAIKLTQTYQDSVIYQTQYQIYSDHIEVNALATKNYILQNYFTGIKSHIRTWVNAKDEALIRHELIKDRYTFSYTNKGQGTINYDNLLAVPLTGGQGYKINYCVFTPKGVDDARIFFVDCISRVLCNSMVFTFGCNDNSSVYTYFDSDKITTNDIARLPRPGIKDSFLDDYGGMPLKAYRYTDDNFENEGIKFRLLSADGRSFRNRETLVDDQNKYQIYSIDIDETTVYDYLIDLYRSPLELSESFDHETNFHKDNKEISRYSYQVEFGVDDVDNLYLGQEFVNRQKYITNDLVSAPNKFYKSKTLNATLPSDKESINLTISVVFQAIQLKFVANYAEIGDVLYVCDNDDNIILAVRYTRESFHPITDGVVALTIYLNKE